MKPLGIEFALRGNDLTLQVSKSNRAIDAIWEAVDEATSANMDPKQFMGEVREAWDHYRKEQAKYELSQLSKQV